MENLHKSGFQKRKIKECKEKEKAKLPKLDRFFLKTTTTTDDQNKSSSSISTTEKAATRYEVNEAVSPKRSIEKFSFICILVLQTKILERTNTVSQLL